MLYWKAAVVGLGVGLLLATAVASIDRIIVARLAWQTFACPDPRCVRMVQIVESEPMHVGIAFALGFAAAFAWSLRRRRPRDVSRGDASDPPLAGTGPSAGH